VLQFDTGFRLDFGNARGDFDLESVNLAVDVPKRASHYKSANHKAREARFTALRVRVVPLIKATDFFFIPSVTSPDRFTHLDSPLVVCIIPVFRRFVFARNGLFGAFKELGRSRAREWTRRAVP
jgi:hypothetical protein